MRRKNSCLGIALLVLMLGFSAFSCGNDEAENINATTGTPSLSVYSANPQEGLRGAYNEGQEAINFETSRSPRDENDQQPADLQRDFNVSIRLQDKNKKTILLLSEGHSFPETWSYASKNNKAEPPISGEIYKLASLAAAEIEKLELSDDVKVEKELLVQQLRAFSKKADVNTLAESEISTQKLEQQVLKLEKQRQPLIGNTKALQQPLNLVYGVQFIDSFWKPAFFNGSNAQHTGTITYRYYKVNNTWFYDGAFVRCNHGSCPGEASMRYYARHWGPVTYLAPATPQMCAGWYLSPHVCNNDTLLQQDNVRNNVMYNEWSAPQCGFTLFYAPY